MQGSRTDALIATVVVGLCNHFSTYVSFWSADKFGRRFLFLQAGFQKFPIPLVHSTQCCMQSSSSIRANIECVALFLICILCVQAGVQMLIALLVIAISLALMNPAPSWLGWYIMAFILLFDSAYAWSWGPLGWVYPFGAPSLFQYSNHY